MTEHIVIKPSWEDYKPSAGEQIIELDPGMAFGTGSHATTRGCIKLMQKYLDDKADTSVLDVGCGSGILGIVAALIGCDNVYGIEIDPDAVNAAKENVIRNGLSDKVKIAEGDLTKGVDFEADIVVANLTVNLIEMLTADVKKHLKKGGKYICSGILAEQKEQALGIMKENGLAVIDEIIEGDWYTFVAEVTE